jgi:hypothetical protein
MLDLRSAQCTEPTPAEDNHDGAEQGRRHAKLIVPGHAVSGIDADEVKVCRNHFDRISSRSVAVQ